MILFYNKFFNLLLKKGQPSHIFPQHQEESIPLTRRILIFERENYKQILNL